MPHPTRNREAWRLLFPGKLVAAIAGKGVKPPPGGWNAEAFKESGEFLIRAMSVTAKIVQRKAVPPVAKAAQGVMLSQVGKIEHRVEAVLARGGFVVDVGMLESVWAQAIDEVVNASADHFALEIIKPVRSVLDQGYAKTGELLGQEPQLEGTRVFAEHAREIGGRITRINEHTRNEFKRIIGGSIQDGDTVAQTAKLLREEMGSFSRGRISTIARTEVGNAWTKGSVTSLNESELLTHVSVIGCESREEDRWDQPSFQQFMYRGEGTCNIEDVPIADAESLRFHPNHSGVLIPSRFRNADGTQPD